MMMEQRMRRRGWLERREQLEHDDEGDGKRPWPSKMELRRDFIGLLLSI